METFRERETKEIVERSIILEREETLFLFPFFFFFLSFSFFFFVRGRQGISFSLLFLEQRASCRRGYGWQWMGQWWHYQEVCHQRLATKMAGKVIMKTQSKTRESTEPPFWQNLAICQLETVIQQLWKMWRRIRRVFTLFLAVIGL